MHKHTCSDYIFVCINIEFVYICCTCITEHVDFLSQFLESAITLDLTLMLKNECCDNRDLDHLILDPRTISLFSSFLPFYGILAEICLYLRVNYQ